MNQLATLALALAAGLIPQPSLAQVEPTPQDAQRFVQTILSQGATRATFNDLQFDRIMDSGWNCGGLSVCQVNISRSGTLLWNGSPDVCVTNVTVSVTETSWTGDRSYYVLRETPSTSLNWKAISATSRSSSTITLSGSSRITSISFATEDVATRVQKAFDLLIQTCDPTRGMGF